MNDFDDECAPHYMSEDDIVADILLYQMTEQVRKQYKSFDMEALEKFYEAAGEGLRKFYRLYDLENPYVDHRAGKLGGAICISRRVVEKVWERLTGKTVFRQMDLFSPDSVWGC